MKITGTSSYIIVEINNKTVKIEGEMMVGGFLAYSDSIKNWEPPHDDVVIDVFTKNQLIQAIIEKSKTTEIKIEFD
jgi:Immunity protein 74